MPDQLESRLRSEGRGLEIEQPPLEVIAARAATLRRRRLIAQAGVATLAVLATAGVALRLVGPADRPPPAVAASDPAATWSAGGITINGLPHLPTDLPGTVRDAEFVDAEHGYLLTTECCRAWISTTDDGGRTWHTVESPVAPKDKTPPTMLVAADGVTVVSADHHTRAFSADGRIWASGGTALAPAAPLTGNARLVSLSDADCGAETAAVAAGVLAPVPQQPPLTVCWRSSVRAGDGSFWVGGRTPAGPAVAVTRDGGATWTVTEFPGYAPTATARAAMLGRQVFISIVGPNEATTTPERLLAVATSTDGGLSFTPPHPTAGQATIGGDLVPLLDGRLLMVDGYGHWLVSEDEGVSWVRLEGLHPTMRLARTQAGYVAYKMSTIYTGFSADGSTWQKLDAQ
ncbi:hypothetical protein Dvina_04610 [Dactylosporangium vinaceum]|uniref:BNR/Asp-box repeat protein n=1 Tax=Dactylosporangium vinaceum TaxID=53362 RepID=A0ABV5MHX3_9ACTN|nr:sialidase family protein [Dactylosporangium vinaceum]UAB97458.1 hypothetical protein Dvina_04610 [Dactylosporangium vinaceum]